MSYILDWNCGKRLWNLRFGYYMEILEMVINVCIFWHSYNFRNILFNSFLINWIGFSGKWGKPNWFIWVFILTYTMLFVWQRMAAFFLRKASTAELDVFYPVRPECQADVPPTRFKLRVWIFMLFISIVILNIFIFLSYGKLSVDFDVMIHLGEVCHR